MAGLAGLSIANFYPIVVDISAQNPQSTILFSKKLPHDQLA